VSKLVSFNDFINYQLFEKNVMVKRNYGSHPRIQAKQNSMIRNEILRFIGRKGKASTTEIREFIEQLNRKTGRHSSLPLIYKYKNKNYIKVHHKNGVVYYSLTPIGHRVLRLNENAIAGGSAAGSAAVSTPSGPGYSNLQNTPGMGNSKPPSHGEIGSGDTFSASSGEKKLKDEPANYQITVGDNVLYENRKAKVLKCSDGYATIKFEDTGKIQKVQAGNLVKI
jgi:plastocyanin